MTPPLHASIAIPTNEGIFIAHYSERGLASLDFPSSQSRVPSDTSPVPAAIRRWHALTRKALKSTLAGKTPGELPPLDVSSGTEFQQRVWEELLWIPRGETRTYGEIATQIRKRKAVRAVGGACGANPIPLL